MRAREQGCCFPPSLVPEQYLITGTRSISTCGRKEEVKKEGTERGRGARKERRKERRKFSSMKWQKALLWPLLLAETF